MREPREYENPLCAQIGGDFWFPEREEGAVSYIDGQYAKSICKRCIHKVECAEWGINKEYFGIWGGLTIRQRQQIRSQRGLTLKQEKDIA